MRIKLGNWTRQSLELLMKEASLLEEAGLKIDYLSEKFIGIPYQESTLVGGESIPEETVINLKAVDCMTFIEYVEALRVSCSFSEFEKNLLDVRYQSGMVAYIRRNHFFSDWRENNPDRIEDVTENIGGADAVTAMKILNLKEDGTKLLAGIASQERSVTYIPSHAISGRIVARMKTGDYTGIFSPRQELDVSHVGIIIKKKDGVHFRHASSAAQARKVCDDDFMGYLSGKPGIIVLRPKEIS